MSGLEVENGNEELEGDLKNKEDGQGSVRFGSV